MDTAYKIYVSILENRLKIQIEGKDLLPDAQAGFRKGRVQWTIYILKHTTDKELQQKGGKVYEFFVDLKAAFDNLNRQKFIQTIKNLGINTDLMNRITEIYEETSVKNLANELYTE